MKRNILLLFASLCLGTGMVKAQYTDLLNFNGANGSEPFGSLTLSGNVLFGTAYYGGLNDSGCVFSIRTDGTHYRDLFDFNGKNGSLPNSPLAVISGKLYGTATEGGLHDSGCVFTMDTSGRNYKDLFNFSGPNGKNPYNTLIYASGVLYGVADGGLYHVGCIFSIDTNGSGYTDMYDFNGTNGSYPLGLTLSGNVLYGMTLEGGAFDYGSIYSIHTNGGKYQDLLDFDGTNGYFPGGALIYSSGKLYGATSDGGANSYGLVFSIDTNGNRYQDLFDFNNTNGAQPEFAGGSLLLSGNILYGETYYGGAYDSGCVFSMDTNGNRYKDLFDFNGINGSNPEGSLTLVGPTLYGATAYGGPNPRGVIFSFDTSVATISARPDTICTGGDAALSVSGLNGATYTWSPGGATTSNVIVSPSTTTTYTVISTQGVTHYTNYITVTVLPLPNPIINGTSIVCIGHRDTLSVSGGTTYKWDNGSTQTDYFTGAINADSTIYVTAYNKLGCAVTDTFKIAAEICTGISEIQNPGLTQVYPNPTEGQFTLSLSHPELVSGTQTIEIYNVLGAKIYNAMLNQVQHDYEINLSSQPNGVYLYRVITENGDLVGEGKIMVQR